MNNRVKQDPEQYEPTLSMQELAAKTISLSSKKANTVSWQIFLLGILAGLYISMGAYGYLVTLSLGLNKLTASVVFCSGLIMVVIAGAELFTGNVIMVTGTITGHYSPFKLFKNWIVVYIANLAASLLAAWLVVKSGAVYSFGGPSEVGQVALQVARDKLLLDFSQYVVLGFFCNMLVILAIVMATMAKDVISKIICIIFPISLFVLCGFEHSVANMFLIPLGMLIDGAAPMELLQAFRNILPVTLGNILGGIFILSIHPSRIRQVGDLIARHKNNAATKERTAAAHAFT